MRKRYTKGLDPIIFHLTNLLLHAVVAVAFFYVVELLLRIVMPPPASESIDWATPVSAMFASLLFAVHPLRVETVAWVTERRDVLSSAFLMISLYCYIRYAQVQGWTNRKITLYLLTWVLLLLSLLSKAWGITFPAILLLLDIYPLRRIGGQAGWFNRRSLIALADKLPLIALSVPFAFWAKQAQASQLATMKSWTDWTLLDRIFQAFYGLFFYSAKTLVPTNLTPLVPLPIQNDPFAAHYLIAALVVVLSAIALAVFLRKWPGGAALAVCYAAILSPVLGFAQSGPQLVADRYSYLACMTWAIAGGAGILWVWKNRNTKAWCRQLHAPAVLSAAALCLLFATLAWKQSHIWKDSRALWTHAVNVDPHCVLARSNLGMLERQAGNIDEAIKHYEAAIAIDPTDAILLNNLAVAVKQDPNRLAESIEISRRAVEIMPKHPDLHFALATSLQQAGSVDEAIAELNVCLRLKPGQPKYHRGLGKIFIRTRQYSEAEKHYAKALELELKLNPRGMGVINALDRLGYISLATGRKELGISYYQRILEIDPQNGPANRAIAKARQIHSN